MNSHIISQRVHQMRPSSFSEEERHRYRAEKTMMRQFMLMKQQDQVPAYLTVKDMKTWLLTGRSFLEEFGEMTHMTEARELLMTELAWTTARRFCLSQMEQELLEELDKEKCLSQQFSRKVTLEGFQMFVSVVHQAAEEAVESLLPPLFRKLLKIFAGIQVTSSPLSTVDTNPAELLELERSAPLLAPEIVEIALKFLLEEPDQETQSEAATAEISKLLAKSAAPCLAGCEHFEKPLFHGICTMAARCMVKAVYKRFDNRSKSFQLMDYDESLITARDSVVFAIKQMETAASSQTHHQLRTSEEPEDATSPVREQTGVVVHLDEVKGSVKEESVPFFSFIWSMMTSCLCGYNEK